MNSHESSSTEHSEPVAAPPAIAIRRRMGGRDIHESNRASSPLEALFDLTTVIAVAAAASRLHTDLIAANYLQAVIDLGFSFFTVWWAWMNFTWFSSAYDTDDICYRLATAIQLVGSLTVAVGILQGTEGQLIATSGYTISRIGLVPLWLRAAREHPECRATCQRYAYGLMTIQMLWLIRIPLVNDAFGIPSFLGMVMLELALPIWAERAGRTPWHPHHMAERYALFTIILLGECLAGAANAMKSVLDLHGWSLQLLPVSFAVVGIIMGLWWTYFLVPFAQVLHLRRERAFVWGYGHAMVFLALTALTSGMQVTADVLHPPISGVAGKVGTLVSPVLAISLVAGAVMAFLATLWWLGVQTTRRAERSPLFLLPSFLIAGAAIAVTVEGLPMTWSLILLVACPAVLIAVVLRKRHQAPERFAVR